MATPPPGDKPVYLTIVHPYPLNANLELPAHQRTLAQWLACCMKNTGVLLAMFHNPTVSFEFLIRLQPVPPSSMENRFPY
jgi:hypothetical protein